MLDICTELHVQIRGDHVELRRRSTYIWISTPGVEGNCCSKEIHSDVYPNTRTKAFTAALLLLPTLEGNTKVHQCRIETDYETVPSAAMKINDTNTLNSIGESY